MKDDNCSEQAARNTGVEIWRKIPDDYYSPAIHVTEQGDIGIKVKGLVLVAPVERWFAAGRAAFGVADDATSGAHGMPETFPYEEAAMEWVHA